MNQRYENLLDYMSDMAIIDGHTHLLAEEDALQQTADVFNRVINKETILENSILLDT